ncbi:MAG TPA: hypothetical protein VJN71_08980 [Nitrososphaerales archaeon]|nr:hypothetical protein [Nitrososphaerales archaeon]
MSLKRKKYKKHEGLAISFAAEDCPVCWKDEQIRRLDLVRRFYIAWINCALDYIRLSDYEGIDKQERERGMGIFQKYQT